MKTNIAPLEAMGLFYRGETLGVWEGDFIKNQKKRGLQLPELVKTFLTNFAYLSINHGAVRFWLPDQIKMVTAQLEDKRTDLLVLGTLRDVYIMMRAADWREKNPTIYLGYTKTEDLQSEEWEFQEETWDLQSVLTKMFLESQSVYDNAEVYNDPDEVQKLITKHKLGSWIEKLAGQKYALGWDEKRQKFWGVIRPGEQTIIITFPPVFTIWELERIFEKVFYQEHTTCDFQHALNLLTRITNYYENIKDLSMKLAKYYKLAGLCCWKLKLWDEAETWYKKAEKLFKNSLDQVLEEMEAFYEGVASFYLAKEDMMKSQLAQTELDRLCKFAGTDSIRTQGERIMRRAMLLEEYGRLEDAIETYEVALMELERDPKDCKYDIARCQQLRGDAKKKLKAQKSKAE